MVLDEGDQAGEQIGALRSTTIAPSLALLQGLRFPQPSNEATVRLSFQYMNLRK